MGFVISRQIPPWDLLTPVVTNPTCLPQKPLMQKALDRSPPSTNMTVTRVKNISWKQFHRSLIPRSIGFGAESIHYIIAVFATRIMIIFERCLPRRFAAASRANQKLAYSSRGVRDGEETPPPPAWGIVRYNCTTYSPNLDPKLYLPCTRVINVSGKWRP